MRIQKRFGKKTEMAPLDEKLDPKGRARLNLLIDEDLKRWAQYYAGCKCTTITALVTKYLVQLRESEHGINVEQI